MSVRKVVQKPSKFAIVNKAVAALNLGDYGKIEGFVSRTADILKRESETATRSISNAEHNHKTELSILGEELDDAVQSVEDAYCSLEPEQLKDNASQRAFRETYLDSIDYAEGIVLGIEKKTKEVIEAHEAKVAGYQKQVDARQLRIVRLTKGIIE